MPNVAYKCSNLHQTICPTFERLFIKQFVMKSIWLSFSPIWGYYSMFSIKEGRISWLINVQKFGAFRMWGRILTPQKILNPSSTLVQRPLSTIKLCFTLCRDISLFWRRKKVVDKSDVVFETTTCKSQENYSHRSINKALRDYRKGGGSFVRKWYTLSQSFQQLNTRVPKQILEE